MAVYRIYVEKKPEFAAEAATLYEDIKSFLQIDAIEGVRVFNRYDVEGIEAELFERCKQTVFAEPQLDNTSDELPQCDGKVFAVEYLPGQFDQRADSCAQCIQMVSQMGRPAVKTAKVYVLFGNLKDTELTAIKNYVINPVESREASLLRVTTLNIQYTVPKEIEVLEGFNELSREELLQFITKYALAMDIDDILFCQSYFKSENKQPTITEIRMIDTYWSDHCRHTTFGTIIDDVVIDDPLVIAAYDEFVKMRSEIGRNKPITLMELATIGGRYLKAKGYLEKLDESEEINACTVKIKVDVDGVDEDWLLLFKNETHNHPTEIEPFGGAATCIGGAIRDPLSGRAYVYQAMRVTGAANPLLPVEKTMKGKLPQRKLVTTAAAGYSSYGNQIGLATGLVDEIYHKGYSAKRLEIGAVIGAAPEKNVIRTEPNEGDIVVLIGGRTGRDGCGGATGSSKSHNLESISLCGAEVQKGNAPEERKLQRLFRNPECTRLIKRCNDFGAGGVSVAIGELADGLYINLNTVPKKYEGLDGTELAISESQERMAVVLEKENVDRFIELANSENLEATVVAKVTREPRLKMEWNGKIIVDVSRDFLNSNGAEKHTSVHVAQNSVSEKTVSGNGFYEKMQNLADDLNVCSKQGLAERFDASIGAGSVLMPFGGKYQLTPTQAMAAKISLTQGKTKSASVMAYGFNPFITEQNQFLGAYLAVMESVCKLVATGADISECYLTFQEYFERMGTKAERWGKPFAALLGALKAQDQLKIAAIGGKDSMSGSFEDIDVPPTLVSFAVAMAKTDNIISPEFKNVNSHVVVLSSKNGEDGLFDTDDLKSLFAYVSELIKSKKVVSAYTPGYGGIAEAVFKMSIGNKIGLSFDKDVNIQSIFGYFYGSFVLELADGVTEKDIENAVLLGTTTKEFSFSYGNVSYEIAALLKIYNEKLEPVFSMETKTENRGIPSFEFTAENIVAPKIGVKKPQVLIPVFPGTNCEYDTARAFNEAGAEAKIFVINNLSAEKIAESAKEMCQLIEASQIIAIPGGFSGGDEPDGSGKFITAFFRHPEIKEKVRELLNNRDGLMCGICNGFQALIKLGLVPFGDIIDTDENCPTLTYNIIGRHQSKLVQTRICSNKSPWLSNCKVGDIHTVAISHGEGRFVGPVELIEKLSQNGQIATQYVDLSGNPSMDVRFNPNGSLYAIEGITSPDGRIFGKMGHSERRGENLYKNIEGNKNNRMFESAVEYFKL